MTEAARERHIAQALAEYNAAPGTQDSLRVPLRGPTPLPVIELPLDIPVLNAASFRIAPLLADHPQAELVRSDPESPAAQEIVASLVLEAHRHKEGLKESLLDGQDQPGVITRKGKLINANTRCVLLRELVQEGQLSVATIRVAVLPADITTAEELELESVLQQQREHKDQYNLVSELMMIKTLADAGGMSAKQIARRLRLGGEKGVLERFAILALMERARRLPEHTLPLSAFIREKDQKENWKELLAKVRVAEGPGGSAAAGDLIIRSWLTPFFLGLDSVHQLRFVTDIMADRDVVDDLSSGDGVATLIAECVTAPPPAAHTTVEAPDGLDLLGEANAGAGDAADHVAAQRLLDMTLATVEAGETGEVELAGVMQPASDVLDQLRGSVNRALETGRRRAKDGTRINRPVASLGRARDSLQDALASLEEVVGEASFASQVEPAQAVLLEINGLITEITDFVEAADDSGDISA
jgi:hypothetical protein